MPIGAAVPGQLSQPEGTFEQPRVLPASDHAIVPLEGESMSVFEEPAPRFVELYRLSPSFFSGLHVTGGTIGVPR